MTHVLDITFENPFIHCSEICFFLYILCLFIFHLFYVGVLITLVQSCVCVCVERLYTERMDTVERLETESGIVFPGLDLLTEPMSTVGLDATPIRGCFSTHQSVKSSSCEFSCPLINKPQAAFQCIYACIKTIKSGPP